LNINFLKRFSRSSLVSLKPKYLQESFITVIQDVLNNFIFDIFDIIQYYVHVYSTGTFYNAFRFQTGAQEPLFNGGFNVIKSSFIM